MRGSEIKQALRTGRRVYGIAVEGYSQPRWPRNFSQYDLDFVFIDTEHTPQERHTLSWAAQAYAANNIAPLVRIAEPAPTLAAQCLDFGAQGVIVPYVETVEQVKDMVGAVKYRPLKGAALRAVLDEGRFPNDETEDYLEHYNAEAVLIIMIESPEGVKNLPAMLADGKVDGVLLGPHDFSVSHGVPEQIEHPIFEAAFKEVIAICKANQVGVGIHYTSGGMRLQEKWIEWGCNLIVHLTDTIFVARGIAENLGALRKKFGDSVEDVDADKIGLSGHAV